MHIHVMPRRQEFGCLLLNMINIWAGPLFSPTYIISLERPTVFFLLLERHLFVPSDQSQDADLGHPGAFRCPLQVFQHGRGKILAKRPQLTVSWSTEFLAVLWKYDDGMGQHERYPRCWEF